MHAEKKYGLFTAICMIVGIVIGSGIFFKSDNILIYTNGNIVYGIAAFIIAAISIIFGSLCIATLAGKTQKAGGIVTYAEEYINKNVACAFGWFQVFVYYPTITAIVSFVAGVYICILFGINGTLFNQVFIGFICYTTLFIFNYLSAKFAGLFQNAATIIKLIPLFLIGIAGVVFGDVSTAFTTSNATSEIATSSVSILAVIAPVVFAYDGWIVATSIAHEIKDSKKNLSKALVVAPLFILASYLLYFVGISALVGVDNVISMGDSHVEYAAGLLFGGVGGKLLFVFIIISVLGTVNGLILGYTRTPYSLALRNMIFSSDKLKVLHPKLNVPTNSIIFAFIVTTAWMIVHFISTKYSLLVNSDISEISIVTTYLMYCLLYIAVIKLAKKGEVLGLFKGYIFPILAIIGSLIIFICGMQNPMFWIYEIFSVLIFVLAYLYSKKNSK